MTTAHDLTQCLKIQNEQFVKALQTIQLLENEILKQDRQIKFLKNTIGIQKNQIVRLLAAMPAGATLQP